MSQGETSFTLARLSSDGGAIRDLMEQAELGDADSATLKKGLDSIQAKLMTKVENSK